MGIQKAMHKTANKNHAFFSCLAASVSMLLGLSVFLASFSVGTAKADTDSGDEAFLIVQDSDGKRWTELDGLNVFENEQFGGRPIVAPGSEGSYAFTVRNIADFPLKYEIGFGEENDDDIPLEFRLSDDDGYLTEDWTRVSGLAGVEEELSAGSNEGYTLEWRWAFEGDDEHDTALGRKAAETEVPYILKISYAAEQTGEAENPPTDDPNPPTDNPIQPSDSPVQPSDNPNTPPTGGASGLTFGLALILCSVTAMLLVPILRRREDDAEDEEAEA